jgi:serine/threonine protein kinase
MGRFRDTLGIEAAELLHVAEDLSEVALHRDDLLLRELEPREPRHVQDGLLGDGHRGAHTSDGPSGKRLRTSVQESVPLGTETDARVRFERNLGVERAEARIVKAERASTSTEHTLVYTLRSRRRRLADRWKPAGAHVRNGEFVKGEPVPGTRYRVLDLVGVGGMGSVYEVEHLELGKRFMLKALLSDLALREDLVARLRNEQRALGRLEHPNIVAVTDAGSTRGNVPYFVMERLDGETLAQRLRRVRRLSPVEALRIANGVLEGLTAAHEIGVVHRDVKPPNIFLASGNRPKILDFGVAKIADAGGAITARGVAVGTPRYMSPEQASGESVDGRSDVYAVGLILFEMIAGAGPFDDARDANEMLLAHLGRRPARLSTRAPSVTPELDALVASLLAKDPASRPPDARTAAAAVRAIERAYGASVATDAPTPYASGPPSRLGMTPELGTTTPGTLTDELTRTQTTSERPSVTKDTLIDDRGALLSGGTIPTGVFLAQEVHSTRTELLTAVAPLSSGNTETNTRVPVTPSDGERTLEPVPVDSPPPTPALGGVAKRLIVATGAVLLLAAVVGGARLTDRAGMRDAMPGAQAGVDGPRVLPSSNGAPLPASAPVVPLPSSAPTVSAQSPVPLQPSGRAPVLPSTESAAAVLPPRAVTSAPPLAASVTPRAARTPAAQTPAPAVVNPLPDSGLRAAPAPKARNKSEKKPETLSGLPSSGL